MIDVKPRELAILVIGPFNEPFDYLFEDSFHKISTGQIVEVPFGRKQSVGIVVGEGSGKVPKEKLKKINDYGFIKKRLMGPIELKSNYFLNNVYLKKPQGKFPKIIYPYSPI